LALAARPFHPEQLPWHNFCRNSRANTNSGRAVISPGAAEKIEVTDDDTDKPGFNGPERRKKPRRVKNERRERMRWELEHPIRRKSPGRRALDRLLYVLGPKR
jgi:hypothetical protein